MCLLDSKTLVSVGYTTKTGEIISYATIGMASRTKYRLRFVGSPDLERTFHNIEDAVSEAVSLIIAAMLEENSYITGYVVNLVKVEGRSAEGL